MFGCVASAKAVIWTKRKATNANRPNVLPIVSFRVIRVFRGSCLMSPLRPRRRLISRGRSADQERMNECRAGDEAANVSHIRDAAAGRSAEDAQAADELKQEPNSHRHIRRHVH